MNCVKNSLGLAAKWFGGVLISRVAIVLLLCAFAALSADAQVQNGIFTGTVTDPQGAAVANADMTITNVGTNATVTIKTNAEGSYRIPELLVGTYKFTVAAPGFKKAVKSGLYLGAGVIERVDFKLELGQQTETVMVEAGAVQVQTEDSRLSETIGAGQVSNLPLNGRNVFDLISLAPGAVDVTGVSFENGHNTVVNGLRPNFSGFLINGSSDKGLSGGVVTVPNADIVQEFQELTLNMSAQYGDSAAAIVNVVTKSGTNSLHGSVYEFFRNDKLDANDFFRNRNNTGTTDPSTNPALKPGKLRFNQFGGTVTGPIWKDHLFFTASYQGDRFITQAKPIPIPSETPEWRAAVIGLPASVNPNPSVAARLYSDFKPTSPGTPFQTLSDFVASAGSGSGFSTFAQYMCVDNYPAGFTQLATRFQNMLGVLPNGTGAGQDDFSTANITTGPTGADPCSVTPGVQAGAISRNIPFLNNNVLLFGSQTNGNLFAGNEWSTRIDWIASKNDRVFGEYYWLHSTDTFGPTNASSGLHGFAAPVTNHLPNFQANWVHTFSPNWVNEARAGYVLNFGNILTSTPGVPSIAFDDGSAGFGSYSGYPQFFHENIYSYGDMMSFQKGKHSFKTGVDFKRNLENSEFSVSRPSYYFFDQLFFALDAPYGAAQGTDPGFTTKSPAVLANNTRYWRNLDMGAFFQDDWKVRHNLTINVGLRYDLYSRHVEKKGLTTTFLPGPGCTTPANGYCADWVFNANVPAGSPGCTSQQQIAQVVLAGVCGPGGFAAAQSLGAGDHNNFGPRIGFAYDPFSKGKTSIRGGFGVSYEGTLFNPQSNSRWNPPYYSFNSAFNTLGGGVPGAGGSAIVYGPTAAVNCNGVTVTPACPVGTPTSTGVANCDYATLACTPSGAAVTYTGPAANPGIGVGFQATGNIQGDAALNPNTATLTGVIFPQGIRDPYILNYYFGFQQEILPKTVLEVNYVGTEGRKLFRAEQINRLVGDRLKKGTCVVIQDGTTVCGLGQRRLNSNYGRIRLWDNVSKSWYNALQVSVRHQATRGLTFNLSYSYSHSIDTGSDWHSGATSANGAAAGDGYSLDVQRPGLDRGNSTFDIRHRLTFNYVYEIPWMKAQKGFARHVFGGWQYQGLWAFQSGAHFTPYCPGSQGSACDFNFDGERNDRPDAPNGNHLSISKTQWANGWFNVGNTGFGCAWNAGGRVVGGAGTCSDGVTPAFFGTPCKACDGNLGRNTFVGPGLFTTDQSIFKNIRMTERFNLQFRTEIFNAFNHANFLLPSSATGGNNGNQISSGHFGQSAGTQNPRLIQFALKLLW